MTDTFLEHTEYTRRYKKRLGPETSFTAPALSAHASKTNRTHQNL